MFAQTVEPNVLLQWLQIIWLDLLLAGDNAIVIAMAVHSLPPRERRLGRLWGTAGAAILRVVFLAIASWLLAIPLLKAAGGIASGHRVQGHQSCPALFGGTGFVEANMAGAADAEEL